MGDRAFVRTSGQGPPALFLHGNPDTGAMWDAVISRVEHTVTAHVPDLPGFGRSPAGDAPISLSQMAGWVDSVLDQVGVDEPIHLAAHDFGGPYACAWAALHPERVATITLCNTLFFPKLRWHRWARVWRTPILGELAALWTPYVVFRAELRRGGPGLSESHIQAAYSAMSPQTRRHVLRLYRAHPSGVFEAPIPGRDVSWTEGWARAAALVPTQVLWGERDPYLRPDSADRLHAARVVRFPQVGHWVPAEDPDGFAREFLAQVAAHRASSGA